MEFSHILQTSVLPLKVKGAYGIEEIIILIVYPDRQLMVFLPIRSADLATPTSKHPLNLNASGSGGSAINSQVLVKSTPVSCFRVILLVLGPRVAASLSSARWCHNEKS
jgi:hypothetical protein